MSLNNQSKQDRVQSSNPIEKDGAQKKPYQAPILHHFGTLWELTAGSGGGGCDAAGLSATGFCCHGGGFCA